MVANRFEQTLFQIASAPNATLWDRAYAFGRTLGHGWAAESESRPDMVPGDKNSPEQIVRTALCLQELWNEHDTIPAGAAYGFSAEDGELVYASERGRVEANLSEGWYQVNTSRGRIRFSFATGLPTSIETEDARFAAPWWATRILAVEHLLHPALRDMLRSILQLDADISRLMWRNVEKY